MPEASPSSDPYELVIFDLLQKREAIDRTISMLQALRAGIAPVPGAVPPPQAPDQGIVETAGMFLGMSIPDAAKKLLALRKRTMSNSEIYAELKAGGLVLTSNDPLNVVGSVLTRRFNNVGDVVRVGRGIWGLKEWYPGRNFKAANKAPATAGEALAAFSVRYRSDSDQPEALECEKASGEAGSSLANAVDDLL